MENDLNMSGFDYNMSLTIFFISYALFEPVTNALLKLMTPRWFFTAIVSASAPERGVPTLIEARLSHGVRS